MDKIFKYSIKILLILILLGFNSYKSYAEEETTLQILKDLQKDIKTLEKAVYSEGSKNRDVNIKLSDTEDDILTKHLLKLSELEEQFQILTNKFEEVNFKLDKLSNRITKVQTDNQLRFKDLETGQCKLCCK